MPVSLEHDDLCVMMPPQPTVAELRMNNIHTCLIAAVNTLEVLADSLNTPFLDVISSTTQSLLQNIQVNFSYEPQVIMNLSQP